MHYKFPTIETIEDIRDAIEGRDEFFIAEREFGYVVNYMVNLEDTFPPVWDNTNDELDGMPLLSWDNNAAIRRECRGIKFGPDGRIIVRPLHKFFNLNEKPETAEQFVSLGSDHVILEKLDGSMITPIPMPDGSIRWGTKMGITDVSMNAEAFIAKHPVYQQLAFELNVMDTTPIFEWCSRKNRIVIDYPEDKLVLVAIRNKFSGAYVTYEELKAVGEYYEIPVVDNYLTMGEDHSVIRQVISRWEGTEGIVIRFSSGHMLKMKGDWYLKIHKCKESLAHEKNLIDLIVNEKLDDLKPHLLPEDLERVNKFENDFWFGFLSTVQAIRDGLEVTLDKYDRKTFALEKAPEIQPIERGIYFACWDGNKAVADVMLETIKKNLGSQSKVDHVRPLWGGFKWTM